MTMQKSKKWRAADRRQSKRIRELRHRADARRARLGIEKRERPPRREREDDE